MKLAARHRPAFAAFLVLVVFWIAGGLAFDRFMSMRVFLSLLGDNAFLGIAAVGATFVILSGGIDLSTGAVTAAVSTLLAVLVEKHRIPPGAAIAIGLGAGTVFGAAQGFLIDRFDLPPFLVTLAGMFAARAGAFALIPQSMPLRHEFFARVWDFKWTIERGVALSPLAVLWLALTAVALLLLHRTRFGRSVYAIGGDLRAARMMGLPTSRVRVSVYAVSGLLSALAGTAYAVYMQSGDPSALVGFELDCIAAVVIGGTLLAGGRGYVLGTLTGVCLLGTVQTLINFHGRLSSWWTRIVVGLLLFLFIAVQRAFDLLARKGKNSARP